MAIPWLGDYEGPSVAVKRAYKLTLGKMEQPRPTEGDVEVEYLNSGCLQWHGVEPDPNRTMWASVAEIRDLAILPGDLLVAEGGDVGRAAIYYGDTGKIFQKSLHRARGHDGTDVRYLKYALRALHGSGWLDILCNKATMAHFTAEKLGALEIPLAPVEEQRRIADFLDTETSRIDAIANARRRQLELCTERRFALTRELLRSGTRSAPSRDTGINWLPDCPGNWGLKKLSHITRCLDGKRIPLSSTERESRKGKYPYYGASTIVDYVDDYLFDEELVLLGEDGAQLGNPNYEISSVVTGKIWVNNHAHVLRPTGINAELLSAILNVFDRELCMSGSTREKITQDAMNALIIPVPPVDEQLEIAQEVEERRGTQRLLERSIQEQIYRLAERRQALITAAVTGQIGVLGCGCIPRRSSRTISSG
jgi:type I restriction enzyme, S subunit